MRNRRAAQPPRRRRRSGWSRLWLWLVETPLSLAVGVGLAAAFLHPRPFWWAQLVAILLPYTATALGALALLAVAGRRWQSALVTGGLVALVMLRAVPSAGTGAADDDLTLTTFNVPQAGPDRAALGDSVAAFVEADAPDLLLLQDTWVYTNRRASDPAQGVQVTAVTERLPYRLVLPARVVARQTWQEGGVGVPLLVRDGSGVEVLQTDEVTLGGGADGSMATRTRFRWNGREAVLYNLHLRSFGEAKPWYDPSFSVVRPRTWRPYLRSYREVYALRSQEVAQLAERIAQETLPTLVAGDFNSTADNWSVRQLRRAGMNGGRRLDGFRAGGGWALGRTYHAARALVRIDLVLVDPAFEVTGAHVSAVAFSDHRPVHLRLRWRQPADAVDASPPADSLAQ
jgi:endonuclease/exonuclease/phosphatase (EEP) superfamily protein YafD